MTLRRHNNFGAVLLTRYKLPVTHGTVRTRRATLCKWTTAGHTQLTRVR